MFHRSMNRSRALALGTALVLLYAAVPAGAQTDEPAEETSAQAQIDAQLGTRLDRETRSLVDPTDRFASDVEKIYCLTRIRGLQAPTTVTHAWYHEGEAMARVALNVGSADWRTWSSKRILPAWTGQWEVKVLDETGKVLHTSAFVIE